MYAWIWRKLPFGFWGKLSGSLGLIAATTALLWYVIFPWATPLLPFDDVQVGTGTEQQGPDGNVVTPEHPADSGAPDEIPYSTESNAPHPSESAGAGADLPGD
jgi:hypothetical protein